MIKKRNVQGLLKKLVLIKNKFLIGGFFMSRKNNDKKRKFAATMAIIIIVAMVLSTAIPIAAAFI